MTGPEREIDEVRDRKITVMVAMIFMIGLIDQGRVCFGVS